MSTNSSSNAVWLSAAEKRKFAMYAYPNWRGDTDQHFIELMSTLLQCGKETIRSYISAVKHGEDWAYKPRKQRAPTVSTDEKMRELEQILKDPYAPTNAKIAKQLGVSTTSIHRMIQKLRERAVDEDTELLREYQAELKAKRMRVEAPASDSTEAADEELREEDDSTTTTTQRWNDGAGAITSYVFDESVSDSESHDDPDSADVDAMTGNQAVF